MDKKKIDIRGHVCPLTFVYTKLALEEMTKGEVLEVLTNFPPATTNVPATCLRQRIGELIGSVELYPDDIGNDEWLLTFKKL